MMPPEIKLARIEQFISHIYDVFEQRPGMLGKPIELPAMLWIADCISDILRGGADGHVEDDRTWEKFLIEKKLLIGSENKLSRILLTDDFEFSCLQQLRREYRDWKDSAVQG